MRTAMHASSRRSSNWPSKAEASRLSELRSQLDREFAQLREAAEQSRISLGVQVEGMQQALRNAMEESSRGLSAHIGEVEDKLDRSLTQATHDK